MKIWKEQRFLNLFYLDLDYKKKEEKRKMNNRALTKNVAVVFFLVFLVSLISYGVFVLGAPSIAPSSFSVNENVSSRYNLTVNNTDNNYNLTDVNILFNSGYFTFVSGTNNSSANPNNFSNSSSSLNWTNISLIDNGTARNFWFNLTASTPGTYFLNITTIDSALTQIFFSSTIIVNDTTLPSPSQGTNPVDYYNSTSSSVTFDIKCSDNYNVSLIQLWGNWNGTWASNYSNSSYTNNTWLNITVAGIPEGSNYKWAVLCNDSAGLSGMTSNRTFTFNAVNASQGINPVDDSYDSDGSITFDMKCSDNTNVLTIQLWTNSTGTWHANYTNSSYTNNTWLNVTVAGITSNLSYKWAVWCNDTNGNISMTSNRTFNVDTADPTVTLVYPGDGDTVDDDSVTFYYTVTDNLDVRNCSLFIDNEKSGSTDTSITENTNQTFARTLAEDTYTWIVECCDYAGHCDNSSAWDLTVALDSGSGSGGGSGGDSDETIITNTTKTTNAGNLTNLGVSKSIVNMAAGDKVIFLFQNTNHTLTMKNISTGSTTENITFLELTSTPIIFSLINNEAKTFDLDGNGKYDFSINATKVTGTRISLLMKAINGSEVILGIGVGDAENATGNETAAKKIEFQIAPESWKWIALAFAVIAVAFAIATGIAVQRKKRRGGFKHHWKKKRK